MSGGIFSIQTIKLDFLIAILSVHERHYFLDNVYE